MPTAIKTEEVYFVNVPSTSDGAAKVDGYLQHIFRVDKDVHDYVAALEARLEHLNRKVDELEFRLRMRGEKTE